ncbi:MAG: hypothetical protein ACOY42_01890 [Pseudomonadota bacterium]|jgi:hypothetical protein
MSATREEAINMRVTEMERYLYASDDLRDLERLEAELESEGMVRPQIHVLTNDEAQLKRYRLHEVSSLMRTDVVRKGLLGAALGVLGCALVIGVAAASGAAASFGWTPFVLLAIVVLGFCTWEAGFLGFQLPNRQFRDFQRLLDEGKHIFFVDVRADQAPLVERAVARHPGLERIGTGAATPWWLIALQEKYQRFVHWAP